MIIDYLLYLLYLLMWQNFIFQLTFKGVLGRHVDRSLKTTWCISIERAEKGCVIVTVSEDLFEIF